MKEGNKLEVCSWNQQKIQSYWRRNNNAAQCISPWRPGLLCNCSNEQPGLIRGASDWERGENRGWIYGKLITQIIKDLSWRFWGPYQSRTSLLLHDWHFLLRGDWKDSAEAAKCTVTLMLGLGYARCLAVGPALPVYPAINGRIHRFWITTFIAWAPKVWMLQSRNTGINNNNIFVIFQSFR